MSRASDVDESSRQYRQAWALMARRAPRGRVEALPGVVAAWSDVALPLLNSFFLTEPVADEADLVRRVEAAQAYAGLSEHHWLFVVCNDWLPEALRSRAAELLARHGLAPALDAVGMAALRLEPPRRPLPELELRRVGDRETRRAIADVNCRAYGLPLEWGREALDVEGWWDAPIHAWVGFVDGEPVATSATLEVDGCRYVALVATEEARRRRGYAEAVMRRSLEDARRQGAGERTILHSSAAGHGLYRAMGYRDVATFTGYARS
jgi:GNAT superfamily N-acetyltransferase